MPYASSELESEIAMICIAEETTKKTNGAGNVQLQLQQRIEF